MSDNTKEHEMDQRLNESPSDQHRLYDTIAAEKRAAPSPRTKGVVVNMGIGLKRMINSEKRRAEIQAIRDHNQAIIDRDKKKGA